MLNLNSAPAFTFCIQDHVILEELPELQTYIISFYETNTVF